MASTELRDGLNEERFTALAEQVHAVFPAFDSQRFLALALPGLDALSLMQRVRRLTESLRTTLPADYRAALEVLRRLAPLLGGGFACFVPPDFVGQYGLDDFDHSMEALKFFTGFGTSEFAVRVFLRHDQTRALAIMEGWSRSTDDAVRRLASEGSRPRLPWSFRLDALVKDPRPTATILEHLNNDSSLYVRKSVANHLNDIAKDHPDYLFERIAGWPLEQPHTRWVVKHGLRTLIKQGNGRALELIGAGTGAQVALRGFAVAPQQLRLGEKVTVSFELQSTSEKAQRLVVDYIVHYVKKSGATSAKVFKLKELTLAPGAAIVLSRAQQIRDFTTRIHHAGRHEVEIVVNGTSVGRDFFHLSR